MKKFIFASILIHLLFFLLLMRLAPPQISAKLYVQLVTEEPDDTESETAKPIKRRKRKSHWRRSQTENHITNPEALEKNPWEEYERNLHSNNRKPSNYQSRAHSKNTAWGNEKLHVSEKGGQVETIQIPRGKVNASKLRWIQGGQRRLVNIGKIDYPEALRKKSTAQGQVELLIVVDPEGRVQDIEIVKSSGTTRLDLNARNAYRNALFSPSSTGEYAKAIITVTFKLKE